MRVRRRSLSAIAALLLSAVVATCGPKAAAGNSAADVAAAVAEPVTPRLCAAEVRKSYPHDPGAFTQGLLFEGGQLYESTGLVGRSSIRRVRLADGKVLQQATVPPPYFGEGMAKWKGELLSLTWQQGKGFRWDAKSLRKTGEFAYTGEGWGLTHDGKQLILSDGTPVLRFLDPATMKVVRTLNVTAGGEPLGNLNELEWVKGRILANVWLSNQAVLIDPASGVVQSFFDLGPLRTQSDAAEAEDVPNGIAYDAAGDRLFVTGKNWSKLFEVRLNGC